MKSEELNVLRPLNLLKVGESLESTAGTSLGAITSPSIMPMKVCKL